MHKTQAEARNYAKMLTGLHGVPYHVVKLAPAEPGSGRARHGITGRFYGGVKTGELGEFQGGGAELLETVEAVNA